MCFRPPAAAKPLRCTCGTINPPTSKKCRKCDALLEVEIATFSCPRCDTQNPVTVKVCKNCGLTAEEATAFNNPKK